MSDRVSRSIVLGVAAAMALWAGALAQEHPSEHPSEHPKAGTATPTVTKEELGEAIEGYIAAETAKGGGAWNVDDPADKAQLKLTLDHVHKDKLASTAPNTYFACADLKNADGHLYDLDVFMTGPDKDHLKVTNVSVHKKDGVERYTWVQKGGVWKKQPVKAQAKT